MARMYSRKRGQSGSTRPSKKVIPNWLRFKPKEVEILITKLVREGKSPSVIGNVLRDSYGIPDVKLITKKSITQILKEKNLLKEIPEDLTSLIRRVVIIKKHMENNHKDMTAKRGIQLTEAKIMRLIKYYKRNKVLPQEWKYDEKTIRVAL